jgi:hypothetical protein
MAKVGKGTNKANSRQNNRRKNKYDAYRHRSTCIICNVVFKSPTKLKAHKVLKHKS